jgi:hypothetical protein
MGEALAIIGAILGIVGYIWLLVLAFSESILWGIGSLLCGLVALVFGITRWPETKVPILLYVAGLVLSGAGQAVLKS